MSDPRLTALAASLPATVPFVGPEAIERQTGKAFRARLGANESIFGPSPKAVEAMQRAASEAWKYPDPESHELRFALADHLDVAVEEIVVGAGIDGLLGSLVRLFVAPGDVVVTSRGAYPTFNYHVTGYGGDLHFCDYRDDHEDPDALIDKAIETKAKLLYLTNPDNPMGSWHPAERIAQLIERVPDGCLLVLDEAYLECSEVQTSPALDTTDPRVIRMRTFSKGYGLAGARVGYAVGHRDIIAAFARVRNHFGVSRVSQAGALAALRDQNYLLETQHRIAKSRERIAAIGRDNGLTALPSATNFVALDLGREGAITKALVSALAERGIFTRMPGVAPLDRCIRITCGPEAEMDLFATVLPEAMDAVMGR
ncbi:Histidinol-phosphate aminotransferase [Rhodobacteraceae bacterium THAF1]|uniref:pyridoxal phosphate-dependent aminotransferase n=1 Tax=Palleronia sp. THAF1 TaxID=2587842 RepID=UPI000F3F413F|nr:pyridoxal phosphate-dependent aminotransferase [Palleronia sp. THAF1]QFU09042.1 Histidinol-phosphate aminotransferase [Palleronia sp. THAF1]VDC24176.1 Histidinol-phosphate aminotransferase [Rhodobacteraceae bacterium THAF1]